MPARLVSAMPTAFRRGWEREGKLQIDALARAIGCQLATRGVYLRFRQLEGEALGVHALKIAAAIGL